MDACQKLAGQGNTEGHRRRVRDQANQMRRAVAAVGLIAATLDPRDRVIVLQAALRNAVEDHNRYRLRPDL